MPVIKAAMAVIAFLAALFGKPTWQDRLKAS